MKRIDISMKEEEEKYDEGTCEFYDGISAG
jgi:hypothetical protein